MSNPTAPEQPTQAKLQPKLCTEGGKFKDHLFSYKWSGRYRKCTRKGCELREWASDSGNCYAQWPCGMGYFELSPIALSYLNGKRWNRTGTAYDAHVKQELAKVGGDYKRLAKERIGARPMEEHWKSLEQNFFMKAKERFSDKK